MRDEELFSECAKWPAGPVHESWGRGMTEFEAFACALWTLTTLTTVAALLLGGYLLTLFHLSGH